MRNRAQKRGKAGVFEGRIAYYGGAVFESAHAAGRLEDLSTIIPSLRQYNMTGDFSGALSLWPSVMGSFSVSNLAAEAFENEISSGSVSFLVSGNTLTTTSFAGMLNDSPFTADLKVTRARKTSVDVAMDGEFLFNDGDTPAGLYIVCSGRVKMCKTSPSGQQLISRIEESGDLAGHITLLAGGNFQTSGEIMGDSVISLIDKNLFMGILDCRTKRLMYLLVPFRVKHKAPAGWRGLCV